MEAVAKEEPQTAPHPAHAMMADIATPPRTHPTQAFAALKSSRDKPALVAEWLTLSKSNE